MSVNAINSVDAQQQKKSNAAGAAVAGGLTLGAAGATTGYFTAKRPDLNKIFAMKPDEFTKTTTDAEGEVKKAAEKISEKIEALNGNEYKVTGDVKKAFDSEVAKQKLADDHAAVTAEKTAQENYDKALLEEVNEGKEEAKKVESLDKAAKKDLTNAKNALKDSEKANALKDAKANVKTAKESALREASKAEGASEDLKNIVTKYDEAVTKAAEKKTGKINELVANEDMKSAYDKIKKLFPKEGKWKRAGIWGVIAAVVGVIAGLALQVSKKAEAPAEQQA